ncbi:MAG TPA: hypothetical protein VF610_11100 [Segetibacter sp.]|jgi:hypothetical protein
MLDLLPAYQTLILRCIQSCNAKEQVEVCVDFIDLFKIRYSQYISQNELAKHLLQLTEALNNKKLELLIQIPVI